jgi:hypothetical protein
VPKLQRWTDPASTAVQIGAGRLAFGVLFAAAPELGVRMIGTDGATARRAAWVARMVAGRDAALGLGTLAAARNGSAAPWLLAGALADTVDAAAVATALKQRRLGGPGAWAVAVGGLPLAALGVAAAMGLRQR